METLPLFVYFSALERICSTTKDSHFSSVRTISAISPISRDSFCKINSLEYFLTACLTTLPRSIRFALRSAEGTFRVHKCQGRIYVDCDGYYDYEETVEALKKVFGIVGICPVVRTEVKELIVYRCLEDTDGDKGD